MVAVRAVVALLFDVAGRDSPRRARYFSLLRQRKVPKRKATPSLRPQRLSYGANLGRGACGVCRRTHCALRASFRQLRQISLRKHARFDAHAHPASTPPQAQPQGVEQPDTGHRCARPGAALRGAKRLRPSGPSAAMARIAGALLAVPRSAGRGAGMRVAARMQRCLTCRSCLNEARSAQ